MRVNCVRFLICALFLYVAHDDVDEDGIPILRPSAPSQELNAGQRRRYARTQDYIINIVILSYTKKKYVYAFICSLQHRIFF